jgi:hypothetical protein
MLKPPPHRADFRSVAFMQTLDAVAIAQNAASTGVGNSGNSSAPSAAPTGASPMPTAQSPVAVAPLPSSATKAPKKPRLKVQVQTPGGAVVDMNLDPPAKWLADMAARNEVFTEKDLEVLGKGSWLKVFLVLMRTPLEVENARFSVEHWDDEVSAGVSRLEWLIELGRQLNRVPLEKRLNAYLDKKFGATFFEVKTGDGVDYVLNEPRFAASFLIEKFVSFDNDTKAFFRYSLT